MAVSALVDYSPRELIIDCLAGRRQPDRFDLAAEKIARQPIDWDALWRLATAERVAPLLYHTTRHRRLVPDWLLLLGREAYLETGLLNALRLKELSSLLAEFDRARIDIILLKGAALVEETYGNVALRPMVDVDLLVRREQIRPAVAILEAMGYQTTGPEIAPDTALEFENELLLWRKDRVDWVIELHWGLFDSPFYQHRLPESVLWASTISGRLEEGQARRLAPELQLLHLCGHLALHHRGQGLLWWNDIAEVIQGEAPHLDWDRLLAQASDLHLVLPLQKILPAAARQWAAPVPQAALDRLAALTPGPEETRVFEQMTADYRPPAQRLMADLQGVPGWGAKARFLARNLFPSAAYMDERYAIAHAWQRPFYYPYRWYLGITQAIRPGPKKASTD